MSTIIIPFSIIVSGKPFCSKYSKPIQASFIFFLYSITSNSSNLPNINIFCETSNGLTHLGVFDTVTDGVLVFVNVKVGVFDNVSIS